jgi:hypothetical protein
VKRLAFAVLCAFLILPAESALAYQDRGFDPDDRSHGGVDPDIRSTVRTVWTTESGLRSLRVSFRAYEELALCCWLVTAALDSREGHRPDYLIEFSTPEGGFECIVFPRGERFTQWVEGALRENGDRVSCRVPVRLVSPTKRIRWRLHTDSGYFARADAAPDHGWYP